MEDVLAHRAAGALWWRAIQLGLVRALGAIRLLLLARLLSPEEFGLFAIAYAVLTVASSLTDMAVVPALVQRQQPSVRESDAGWTLGLLRAALLALALVVAAKPLTQLFQEPRAVGLLRGLALLPIAQSLASIGTVVLIRRLQFRSIALLQVSEALAQTIIAVGLASLVGAWALVAGALGGAALASALSYAVVPHRPRLLFNLAVVLPVFRFGGWLLLATALISITDVLLRSAIARELGASALGLFSMAASLTFLPLSAAGQLSRAVAFPLYTGIRGESALLRQTFLTFSSALAVVLLPVYALLIALAGRISADLLGEQWLGVAPVLRILSATCIVWLVAEAATPLFQGTGRPRLSAAVSVVQFVLVATLAGPLSERLGVAGAALTWLAAAAGSLITCICFLVWWFEGALSGLARRMSAITIAGAAAGFAALGVSSIVPGVGGIAVGLVSGLGLAVWLLRSIDRRFTLGLRDDLRRIISGHTTGAVSRMGFV
jgi:O-antigen/teichoic acid export membrane protein